MAEMTPMAWSVVAIALILIAGGGFLVWCMLLDRREEFDAAVRRAALDAENERFCREEDADMQAREDLRTSLRLLPWSEVRRRCEDATGRTCECHTKREAADRIHRARTR